MSANTNYGNILSRLQGLKNVSGRRVMPGNETFQNLEEEEPDISGIASEQSSLPDFANFIPPEGNVPQSDMGGQLTSQSYDVRANDVEKPEQDTGFFSRLGQALADYVSPQKRAEQTAKNQALIYGEQPQQQENIPENIAIETEMQNEPQIDESVLGKLKSAASQPFYGVPQDIDRLKPYIGLEPGNIEKNKGLFTPKLAPEFYEQHPEMPMPPEVQAEESEKKRIADEAIKKAEEDPWNVVAYGATDAFANKPEVVKDFQEYTGINFDEQQKELTAKYEKVLSDIENGVNQNDAQYDEQEKRIKERILSNQSTDADKYYIGLALLMPLLIGGLFGKEAGFGALAGTAKGIGEIYKGREESTRKNEEMLTDIYNKKATTQVKKGELELEKLKIPQEVKKMMPKDEYKDLKGLNIYSFTDPKTGEMIGTGYEAKPDLYVDLDYANTEKKREKVEKQAEELSQDKAALEIANRATSNVINAATQLEDPTIFAKVLSYALAEKEDGALKKAVRQKAPMIHIDGRNQNAAVYIDSQIEQIKDAYRRNEQMRAFTQTVAHHVGVMAENPLYTGMRPEDLIDQMLILRDRAQNFFVERAKSQGFIAQPLENKFGAMNKEVYKKLNKKEEKKEIEKDKALLHGS